MSDTEFQPKTIDQQFIKPVDNKQAIDTDVAKYVTDHHPEGHFNPDEEARAHVQQVGPDIPVVEAMRGKVDIERDTIARWDKLDRDTNSLSGFLRMAAGGLLDFVRKPVEDSSKAQQMENFHRIGEIRKGTRKIPQAPSTVTLSPTKPNMATTISEPEPGVQIQKAADPMPGISSESNAEPIPATQPPVLTQSPIAPTQETGYGTITPFPAQQNQQEGESQHAA